MNRILLIALLFVFVWYLWWRVRRRFAQIAERFRQAAAPPRKAPSQRQAPRATEKALTLEKDPVTGIYRPPEA